jgi:hypothetical protein
MNFQTRISRGYADVSGIIAGFAQLSSTVVAFEHLPDAEVKRLHTHLYVFGYIKKEDTCRNFIKAHDISGGDFEWSQSCGKKPNTRPIDLSGAIIYGSKGELKPVFVKNVDEAVLKTLTIEAKDPKYHPKKQTKLMLIDGELDEKAKVSSYQLIQIMISRIKKWDTPEVITIIRDVLIEHKQKLGMYKVQDYYDSCLMYGNRASFIKEMVSMIDSRHRRMNKE